MTSLSQTIRNGQDRVVAVGIRETCNKVYRDISLTPLRNWQRLELSKFLVSRCFSASTGVVIAKESFNIRPHAPPVEGFPCQFDSLIYTWVSSSLLGVYFQDHVLSTRGGHPDSLINNHETIFEPSVYQGHLLITYIHKVVAYNNSLDNLLSVFVMCGGFPEDVMAGRNVKIGSGDEQDWI